MARLLPVLALAAACTVPACGRPAPGRALAPVPEVPAPLPTGLGPLRFPVPGGTTVGLFGWTERAAGPFFTPYLRIRAAAGEAPEVAVAAGSVAAVHDDPVQLGLYVEVVHARAWASIYGGCGAVVVVPGQPVASGATVCTLPQANAVALFGLLLDGQPVNPQPYLEPA